MLQLTDLMTTKEAQEFLGMKEGPFKYQVYKKKSLVGLYVGGGGGGSSSKRGTLLMFTRSTLLRWMEGENPAQPLETEVAQVFGTRTAAEYTGRTINSIEWYVRKASSNKRIPHRRSGQTLIFVQSDLDQWMIERGGSSDEG